MCAASTPAARFHPAAKSAIEWRPGRCDAGPYNKKPTAYCPVGLTSSIYESFLCTLTDLVSARRAACAANSHTRCACYCAAGNEIKVHKISESLP